MRERFRVGCVEGDGVELHRRAHAVALAQVERVPGRVGEGDPGRPLGQPRGAQLHRPGGRGLVAVDQQVEVELLRPLLARPLRRHVVGSLLERELLPDGSRTVIQSGTRRTTSPPVSSV